MKQRPVRTVAITVPNAKPGYSCFEPHIAADPDHPSHVLLTAIFGGKVGEGEKARWDSRLLAWHSNNGGQSWSPPSAPFYDPAGPALRIGADPVVAFGKGDRCWLVGNDYDFPVMGKKGYQSLKLSLSEDGGKTWKPPIAITELDNQKNGKGIVDKPWLAVDTGNSQRQGTLYVAWTRWNFDNLRSELWCTALPPGATECARQVRLGEPLDLKSGSNLVHQVQLAVRRDGTLDAIWRMAPTDRLVHVSSTDGAKTFSKPVPIAANEMTGTGEFPSLTATPGGNLFLAWGNQGTVLCSVLSSGRWSTPRPLAGDLSEGTLSHRAVAATADALWVMAYRKKANPEGISVVRFRSDDQGKKWKQDRILATREFLNGEGRHFHPGDYVGLAAVKNQLYAAYVLPKTGREKSERQLCVTTLDVTRKK